MEAESDSRESREEHGFGERHGRVGLTLGSGAAVFGLAILMILASGASAAPVHPLTTHSAPYSGVEYVTSSAATSGCGHASVVTAPSFNMTTGVAKGAVSASSSNCAPSLNGNYGSTSETIGLSSNNFTTTTATHTVTAQWTLHWKFNVKTNEPTGRGTAEAIGTVSISVLVFDSTNFSVAGQKSWFKQYIDVGNVTTSNSGGVSHTLTLSVALVATHVYYIYVTAYLFAYGTVASSPGGTASSNVDLAAGKDQGTLLSYSFK